MNSETQFINACREIFLYEFFLTQHALYDNKQGRVSIQMWAFPFPFLSIFQTYAIPLTYCWLALPVAGC